MVDNYNYASSMGGFNLGAMLCSDQEDIISPGILVGKSGEQRPKVAFHCWDRGMGQKPEKPGEQGHFRVKQADAPVSYVTEPIQISMP